jgi:heat shock protein HslJ
MKILRVAMLTLAVLATTGADAQRGRASGQDQSRPSILKREKQFPVPSGWVVASLNGKAYTGVDRPTFRLDTQYRATGFGGCNTYSATAYPLREQRFAVGPINRTKKQCAKDVMESEQAFLVALRTAAQWDLDGVTLVIRGQNGELRFDRSI